MNFFFQLEIMLSSWQTCWKQIFHNLLEKCILELTSKSLMMLMLFFANLCVCMQFIICHSPSDVLIRIICITMNKLRWAAIFQDFFFARVDLAPDDHLIHQEAFWQLNLARKRQSYCWPSQAYCLLLPSINIKYHFMDENGTFFGNNMSSISYHVFSHKCW